MQRGQAPDAIDTRLVFRIYSWIAIASGLVVFNSPLFVFPALLSERGLPDVPWGKVGLVLRDPNVCGHCASPLYVGCGGRSDSAGASTNISARRDDRNGGDDLQFHVRRRLGTSLERHRGVIAAITVARYIAAWHRIREHEVLA